MMQSNQIKELKKELFPYLDGKKYRWSTYQPIRICGETISGGFRSIDERFKLIDVNDIKGKSIVDLGCNVGMSCYWAVEKGAIKAVGYDNSTGCIEIANIINKYVEYPCEFYAYDLGDLECNGTFNVGFMFAVDQYIKGESRGRFKNFLRQSVTDVLYFESNLPKRRKEVPDDLKELFSKIEFLGETDKGKRAFYRCIVKQDSI